ncbi:hypothetical protein FRC06_006496 [Ceratobasidium sp. 370]|nr:hypothetical protein FRC06_006496 [Ceratobasidium sp. 370]
MALGPVYALRLLDYHNYVKLRFEHYTEPFSRSILCQEALGIISMHRLRRMKHQVVSSLADTVGGTIRSITMPGRSMSSRAHCTTRQIYLTLHQLSSESDSHMGGMFEDARDDWATPKASLDHSQEVDNPGDSDTYSEHSMAHNQHLRETTADPKSIPLLGETDIWVERHPVSGQRSGLLAPKPRGNEPQAPPLHSKSQLPSFFPFRTLDDFIQAEIFSDYGATDNHIDRQLRHDSKSTLRDAKDFHNTLKIASQLHGEFITKPVVTRFEEREFINQAHFQPPLTALTQLVGDPDFASDMVYYPEELHVHRPGTNGEPMQVWEELWHAKLWWNLQASLSDSAAAIIY